MDSMPSDRKRAAAERTASSSRSDSSEPSNAVRPGTSWTRSGGTGRSGLTQTWGLASRSMLCRPISSTYLNPSDTSTPTGVPLPSRIALVAMVVPRKMRLTCEKATPFASSIRVTPAMKPRDGSSGVEGVLRSRTWPVARFRRTTSVKVPPTSMARA